MCIEAPQHAYKALFTSRRCLFYLLSLILPHSRLDFKQNRVWTLQPHFISPSFFLKLPFSLLLFGGLYHFQSVFSLSILCCTELASVSCDQKQQCPIKSGGILLYAPLGHASTLQKFTDPAGFQVWVISLCYSLSQRAKPRSRRGSALCCCLLTSHPAASATSGRWQRLGLPLWGAKVIREGQRSCPHFNNGTGRSNPQWHCEAIPVQGVSTDYKHHTF